MQLTIHAYSTALFSTWINLEELGLLFDAGDGVTSSLLQKSGKIKHVFISHPDRDHITGLFQLNQLNGREGFPRIFYPKHSGTFPAMRDFQEQFDPHTKTAFWQGITAGDQIAIRNDLSVEALRNEHIACDQNTTKSLSFKLHETKQKLKEEFRNLSSNEVKNLVEKRGKEFLMESVSKNLLSYSADTPVDDYSKWDNSEILIHEATFIQDVNGNTVESKGNKHSQLHEVLRMVSEINVQQLVLTHFSSRYDKEEIKRTVQKLCNEYNITIPVRVVYPGEISKDLLAKQAVNS